MSTPRTNAACFSATTEKPESGDFELCVVDVEVARKLELDLAAVRTACDECERQFQAKVAEVGALLDDRATLGAISAGLSKEYQDGDKRSGDLIDDFTEFLQHHQRLEAETKNVKAEITALRKELAEVTAAFRAECDHTFVTEDHSFSHEFGTEKIFVCRCSKCGKDAEPDDVPDPDDDGCDDGPRDPRELREIDP